MKKQSEEVKAQKKRFDGVEIRLKGRMLFPHLVKPVTDDQGRLKYSMQLMWPDDTAVNKGEIERIKKVILDHKKEWYPNHPNFIFPIKHYDSTTKKDGSKHPTYLKGHYWMNLGNNKDYPPAVFDHTKKVITDEAELTNGRNCLAIIKFFPYDRNGNTGVSASIKVVVLLPGGEVPFGNEPINADELFADIGDDINSYVAEEERKINQEIAF